MSGIAITIIVLLLAGLMYFGGHTPPKERSRDQLLKDLGEYLEGSLDPIQGKENSFRIRFTFEDENFVYENIQTKGFRDAFFRTYLKVETLSRLSLNFTEKEHRKIIRSEVVRTTGISDKAASYKHKIFVPKKLQNFDIHSNNPGHANELLGDPKVLKILLEFKNVDSRGYHFLSLEIVDGVVILEFHPSGRCNPTPLHFLHDFDSIEILLDKLLVIVNRLNNLS